MANLKEADSPLCRRIVLSFLDFLNSVEPTSVSDFESLEVTKDCLCKAFKIDSSSSTSSVPKFDSLVQIFSSHPVNSKTPEASQTLADDTNKQDNCSIVSEDELFAQFFGALEKARFFRNTPNEAEDLKKSGGSEFDIQKLADTFKLQGNKAMQSKLYPDAIERYSVAIALCDDNAVYYCNRAAAYTKTKQYTEAISDCQKAIEIDPSYIKAYSRLGFVYFAQGNFNDAIHKGYKKALQLDPENEFIKGNCKAAVEKVIIEERLRVGGDGFFLGLGGVEVGGMDQLPENYNEIIRAIFQRTRDEEENYRRN
ncbi:small glutamine-rich tetratricopeptide repeat-containing protein 2-like isoform X2 [Rutidosis leptorrhynchoides]|uniref:small glutamine-rich tetratricopeptide repeat-containing protein 2-like isoform X2 n=1 Tax=Rutidosis leptorrhynchoides TaxID=125765 RepID=UPI003A993B8B